jgi:hypothetical protein
MQFLGILKNQVIFPALELYLNEDLDVNNANDLIQYLKSQKILVKLRSEGAQV